MRRVVGLFDNHAQAVEVQNELIEEGIPASNIHLGDQSSRQQEKGFWDKITDFFSMEERDIYQESAERGGTLVIADVDESHVEATTRVMSRHNPVDIQRRVEERHPVAAHATTHHGVSGEEERIPVTEERMKVDKRWEEHGGVRVYTEVEEVPVSADVELREEKVHVERRAVDRPAQPGDFQERTIEAAEGHEEAIVSKEARVIEEVVVSKEVGQRTETVEDTVRRTRVRFEDLEEDFRQDYQKSYAGSGYSFDQIRAAYDYGRDLAIDERNRGRDWPTVEPEARRAFEQRNPGKWEKFGPAVHRGYDQTRARAGAR